MKLVKTSYDHNDVTILLKDLTDEMKPMSTEERERAIQSGTHYSEMLPEEKRPTAEHEEIFENSLKENFAKVARHVKYISFQMKKKSELRKKKIIVVSLARAGIPVGILINRDLKLNYAYGVTHYSISIIRDKGIDVNAMEYIYKQEIETGNATVEDIYFVDGWTGKGAILTQLEEAVADLKAKDSKWDKLRADLYVLADPAGITPYCGTREDYMIPSACLNSTVSGLISRTILNDKIDVENGDFHGAVYFKQFEDIDRSKEFIEKVWSQLVKIMWTKDVVHEVNPEKTGMITVKNIQNKYNISDYKKIKPGIGETTRVLLRRVPWKVLVDTSVDMNNPDDVEELQQIMYLCEQKHVPIETCDIGNYKVCGIIKELADA